MSFSGVGRADGVRQQILFGNDKQWNRQRRDAGVPVRLAALAQGRLSTTPLRGSGRDDGGVGGPANKITGSDRCGDGRCGWDAALKGHAEYGLSG